MAHYIAEKIAAASSASGKAKKFAQRECFETILTLWNYQSRFPHDARPFKDLDPVFRAMAHIDPNNPAPSYFRNENEDKQPPKEIEHAIELITSLDSAARIMISFFVRESVSHVTDSSILEWIDAISGIAEPDEARFIFETMTELDDKEAVQNKNEKRKNELTEHINRLEAFEGLSREIKLVLKSELGKLEI